MSGESNENPVENVSVTSTTRAPLAAAPAIIGHRCAKFASRSCHDDVVLDRCNANRRHDANPATSRSTASIDHVDALAAGEPHEVTAVLGPGVEDLVRHGDDTAALGQRPAERHPVAVGRVWPDVDGGEVGRLGFVGDETGLGQSGDEVVARRLQRRGEILEVDVRQPETNGHRRLERRTVHVGEELLRRLRRGHQRFGARHPADLPPGGVEGLAARGDRERPFGHVRQRGHRNVGATVEEQVLVHLVGDHDEIVLDRDPGDRVEFVPGEHLAGRVVRGVEQDHLGPRGHRSDQLVGIEDVPPVVTRSEQHGHRTRPGERDARLVAVVHRLEDHDFVTGVEHPQQRSGQRLGRTSGDHDLARRIEVDAVPLRLVPGDGLAQQGHPRPRRILVDARTDGRDRGVEHLGRAVGVGEALAEVDRSGLDRQRGHLGEDRGAEARELAGERIGQSHTATVRIRCSSRRLAGATGQGVPSPDRVSTRLDGVIPTKPGPAEPITSTRMSAAAEE